MVLDGIILLAAMGQPACAGTASVPALVHAAGSSLAACNARQAVIDVEQTADAPQLIQRAILIVEDGEPPIVARIAAAPIV